eukprot:3033971-Rhodomonas_salina.1
MTHACAPAQLDSNAVAVRYLRADKLRLRSKVKRSPHWSKVKRLPAGHSRVKRLLSFPHYSVGSGQKSKMECLCAMRRCIAVPVLAA